MEIFNNWKGFTNYIRNKNLEVYDFKNDIVFLRNSETWDDAGTVLLEIK